MESSGDGGGRRQTNLREAIRVNNNNHRNKLSGLTLAAILNDETRSSSYAANRTLFDVIREDSGGKDGDKKAWKIFKPMLRRGRSGSNWTSSVPVPVPASDIAIIMPNNNRLMTHQSSTPLPGSEDPGRPLPVHGDRPASLSLNASRSPERASSGVNEDPGEEHRPPVEGAAAEGGGGEQPVRMSLMSLLAENGGDELMYTMGNEEEEDEEEEEEEEMAEEEEESGDGGGGGGEYDCCCVCMVRHKGAAFIPCGHTFCRLCSRELWVQRGNCPLCNNFILEILDIF